MKRLLLVFLLLSGFPIGSIAQGISSDGRDYYVVMMTPSQSRPTSVYDQFGSQFFEPSALITSLTDGNNISISYFDDGGQEVSFVNFRLSAHQSKKVVLDNNKMELSFAGERPEYKSCHIVSNAPINVEYHSTGFCSGGGYLVLPIQCLGKKYVVMGYHDNASGLGGVFNTNPSSGFCVVTAAFNNTFVQITPNSTTYGGKPGVRCGVGANLLPQPFTFSLSRGQSYMFKSAGKDDNCDISGSTILSNKPISVVAGHENAHSDVSDVGNYSLDERDYMVEQMLPVECFDTTGYYTMPFFESSDLTDGNGDEVHVFCDGTNSSSVVMTYDGKSQIPLTTSPYPNPAPGKTSIINSAQYYSLNKQPFAVMMYDQRAQSSTFASPAPSMMSIIPRSHWKSEYFFQILASIDVKLQAYYFNLLCSNSDWNSNKLMIGVNGAKPVPLRGSGLALKKTSFISGTDVIGFTFAAPPGSYYLSNTGSDEYRTQTRNTFTVYSYDYHTFDPDNDLGELGTDHTITSNANPVGMSYAEYGVPVPQKFSAVIEDNCDSWSICVTDSGAQSNGIKYIELINYANISHQKIPPQAVNVSFDNIVDPLGKREICLEGDQQKYCFNILRQQDPTQCEAVVAIYDNSGERLLIDLPKQVTPLLASRGNLLQQTATTFQFTSARVDSSVCGTVTIKSSDLSGLVNVTIKDIHVPDDGLRFKFTSTLPTFPLTLRAKDSIVLNFCYVPTDTLQRQATMTVTTTCPTPFAYTLIGKAKSGLIDATDITFSSTFVKSKQCKQLSIKDIGSAPFTITGYTLSDTTNFTIDPTFISSLPLQLSPGMTVPVQVCFNPMSEGTFSATIQWLTDIPELYKTKIKSYSQLNAKSTTPQNAVHESDTPLFSASMGRSSLSITLSKELINHELHIELFDLLGRSIMNWDRISSENIIIFPIANIAIGTYLLRLSADGAQYSKMVMVAQ